MILTYSDVVGDPILYSHLPPAMATLHADLGNFLEGETTSCRKARIIEYWIPFIRFRLKHSLEAHRRVCRTCTVEQVEGHVRRGRRPRGGVSRAIHACKFNNTGQPHNQSLPSHASSSSSTLAWLLYGETQGQCADSSLRVVLQNRPSTDIRTYTSSFV